MSKKQVLIAIAIAAGVVICALAVIFFGNSMYEWMLRAHGLR